MVSHHPIIVALLVEIKDMMVLPDTLFAGVLSLGTLLEGCPSPLTLLVLLAPLRGFLLPRSDVPSGVLHVGRRLGLGRTVSPTCKCSSGSLGLEPKIYVDVLYHV